jgi:signal transduction histidine kinase
MKLTLRWKFMLWLCVQTLVVFTLMAGVLFLFNLHEQAEHPGDMDEELAELEMVMGLTAACVPVALAFAWLLTGRLLSPLRQIVRGAETIREGALDHRIQTPVLDDEIGKMARALNGAFDSHQDAQRRLDRFSRDAAHQLRNPLAAIRAEAEVCLASERPPEEYQQVLERIIEDTRMLGHTVDQLLMLARLGRGDMASMFEPLDLAALVRSLADGVAPLLDERGIRLEVALPGGPVGMRGSPQLIEQAVANILDNAIRLTPDGGLIRVGLSAAAGEALLRVADSGPGIPNAVKETIFRRWAEGHNHPSEGSGLGLAIAADVVRLHRGTIAAQSAPEGGAEFLVHLPLSSAS